MTHDAIRTRAHDLVIGVDLELEVVMPADRDDGPEGEGHATDTEDETEPGDRLGALDRRTGAQPDDDVRHPEEVRRPLSDANRTLYRWAASLAAAGPSDLRHKHKDGERADEDRGDRRLADPRHAKRPRSRSAESAFEPSSSWRKYAYTSVPAATRERSRAAHLSIASSV